MKALLLATSLAVAGLAPGAALTHDDHHGHRERYSHHDRGDHHDRRDRRDHRRDRDRHHGWKRQHYRRGERIEVVHVERHYYVDDYHHHRLRQPPRGHRWIRTDDGRYLLVAVATGIIADVLLHH